MGEQDVRKIKELLKKAGVQPLEDAEPRRDLWPAMRARLIEKVVRVPWWDWVLLAGASLSLWFFPAILPALLYHL